MTDYLDRYTRDKGWKALKFIAGRGVQSAELNEVQSVLRDELYQLGRTVWSDGQVIRGCELTVLDGNALVAAGQVYFDKAFHDFPGGQVAITGAGLEIIGLRFAARIVTEAEDASLHDPASGWENSGYAGAHRLVYDIAVTRNASDAVSLYALQDGLFSADYRPQPAASELSATLARRTYDESGDYIVRGLRCRVIAKDATTFWLVVGDGKAYVKGSEFTVPAATRTVLDRPLEYRTVTDEPKTFSTGTATYLLTDQPVKEVVSVSAVVQTSSTLTRGGTPNGSDLLPKTPVSSIVSISGYTQTTDYVLSGNSVSWAPGGAEPSSGSSYTVTYRYVKQMVVNTDFVLTNGAIDFTPGGDDPVNGSVFYVTYNHYLPRHDTVIMNARGELKVVKGVAGLFSVAPTAPADTLPIAYLHYGANVDADAVTVETTDRTRLTMEEIAKLRARIADLEYNAAVTDLEQEAINVQLATSKKAIFTDSFRDTEKMDAGDVSLSCAIGAAGDNLDTLYPGYAVAFTDLSQPGRFALRAWTETAFAGQSFATHQTNVNPYAVFNNAGVLSLNPPADVWVTDATITRTNTVDVVAKGGEEHVIVWDWWRQWTDRSLLSEESISGFGRELTVTVTGKNYFPYSDDLRMTFDGVLVPLTAVAPTLPGSIPESVKADAAGAFTATFDVPAGTVTGSHEVTVFNDDNTGSTQYFIDGRLRTWLSQTTIERHGHWEDPVAESFQVPYDLHLAALDLFFAEKDAAIPVSVSVRGMDNGYPNNEILAETVLTPAQVSVSSNASAATHVAFASPPLLRAGSDYCFVVASQSNAYYLHYARLGGVDISTGQTVIANPFAGVMFTSANAATWTAHQEEDLKFTLYRAEFGTTARVIDYGTHTVDGSQVTIMASVIEPYGTSVTWAVQPNGAGDWVTIPANVTVDLGVMLTSVKVRATLAGTATLSPVLFGAAGLVVAKWDASGVYISRDTTLSAYTSLRVYLDLALPSGCTVQPYYSVNGGTNWITCGSPTASHAVNTEFTEYEYQVSGLSNPTTLKMKLALASSADRLTVPRVRRLRTIAT